jgi:predicted DNA-binding transcriptional regulator YafY
MQINRLFEIVYILLEKKSATAAELSQRFEVSQRTVYRDIEALCQAGIPVCTQKGRSGGISLPENFVLNKSLLTPGEQGEILAALKGLHAVSSIEGEAALSKLSSLFGDANPNWIEVDFSNWSNVKQEKFSEIKAAVIGRRVILFDYYGASGEKTARAAEPLQLWFKDRTWYVKAFCRLKGGMRTFKLSRMVNLRLTEEIFDRTLPKEIRDPNKIMPPSEYWVQLTMEIDASMAYRVYDELDESEIEKKEDGSFLVTVSFPEDQWVYGWILSFGCHARVLEPAHVREWVKDILTKTLAAYT